MEAPNTFRPFVNVVSASDFKTIYGVSLSEAPDLELVNEHGEYKSGSMSDKQESYSVATYGKVIYLTRQMIVNDDLRAFTRLPQLMGAAARRKEGDLVWAKITGNPTMNDGTTLFHADHSNLETDGSDKGSVDSEKLSVARTQMRTQTGPGGATLDLQPRFLLVPVAQETSAEILLRSTALPQTEYSEGVYNPWANRLTPIAEPRLDNNSALAWYLVADPNQIDTIEVAYLDGREEPYTEEEVQFDRDAVGYKIRHDFGCGVMDHRGFFKNPGE
jgi:phage major head subunit gpT-like protein